MYDSSLSFLNTFLIRAFADFYTHKRWISLIQAKIQKKLNTIKVPYFMEDLRIEALDLGSVIPLIKQCGEPWYDEKGLWVHLDIDYSGGMQMSLATKLNLMKLKKFDSSKATTATQKNSSSSNNLEMMTHYKASTSGHESDSEETPSTADEALAATLSQQPAAHDDKEDESGRAVKHAGAYDSAEEDSAESSGDEYGAHGLPRREREQACRDVRVFR